jgi:hypothetical protein
MRIKGGLADSSGADYGVEEADSGACGVCFEHWEKVDKVPTIWNLHVKIGQFSMENDNQ